MTFFLHFLHVYPTMQWLPPLGGTATADGAPLPPTYRLAYITTIIAVIYSLATVVCDRCACISFTNLLCWVVDTLATSSFASSMDSFSSSTYSLYSRQVLSFAQAGTMLPALILPMAIKRLVMEDSQLLMWVVLSYS